MSYPVAESSPLTLILLPSISPMGKVLMKAAFRQWLRIVLATLLASLTGLPPAWCVTSTYDASEDQMFYEIVTDESHLQAAQTTSAFLQNRAGYHLGVGIDLYGVTRLGGDTRTLYEKSDKVYNDNFFFGGIGCDYSGLIPGVKFITQFGASKDLYPKIHLQGIDGQAGFASSHDWRIRPLYLYGEIASEAFYVRRYQNIRSNLQFRSYFNILQARIFGGELEFSPTWMGLGAIDQKGYDYNRFWESRMGMRVRYQYGRNVFTFGPYYVLGGRWQKPTSVPYYSDLRLVMNAVLNF